MRRTRSAPWRFLPGGFGVRLRGRKLGGGHLGRDPHGLFHASGIGAILAGDVEGGAVIDAGADDRNAERDVDRAFEIDQLHRNVTLVMILGDDQIVGAADGLQEHSIRRVRSGASDAARAGRLDCGQDAALVFIAEKAVLAGVRIEAADGDARTLVAEKPHRFIAEFDGAQDTFDRGVTCLAKRDVGGDVDRGELLAAKQHAAFAGAAEFGDVLGMAGEGAAGQGDGFLIERRGNHGGRFAAQAHPGRRPNVFHGSGAAPCAEFAETERFKILERGDMADVDFAKRKAGDAGGEFEDRTVAGDDPMGERSEGGVGERVEHDLGADAGRISHGQHDRGLNGGSMGESRVHRNSLQFG